MSAGFAFPRAGFIWESIGLRAGERPQQNAHVREYRGHRRDQAEAWCHARVGAALTARAQREAADWARDRAETFSRVYPSDQPNGE